MQIPTQIDKKTRERNVATNENCILRKMGLKCQNPRLNILCKVALYGVNCQGKKAACLVGQP